MPRRWPLSRFHARPRPASPEPGTAVRIRYTNWKGETADRVILPVRLWFGSTEWHPVAQHLLEAVDLEKFAYRSFAMKDIHAWEPAPEVRVPGRFPSRDTRTHVGPELPAYAQVPAPLAPFEPFLRTVVREFYQMDTSGPLEMSYSPTADRFHAILSGTEALSEDTAAFFVTCAEELDALDQEAAEGEASTGVPHVRYTEEVTQLKAVAHAIGETVAGAAAPETPRP